MNGSERVILTGATGFLGGYTARELQREGFEVVAVGRNPEALAQLEEGGIETYRSDLADMHTLVPARGAQAVVHMAALSSPWGRRPDFMHHNVRGTQEVVSYCNRNGIDHMVHISSPSIYTAMGHQYDITENTPPSNEPLNYYIESKVAAEAAIRVAHTEGLLGRATILRPRGLIGIGDPVLLPRLLEANNRFGIPLFNGGTNNVDLTCVENVALAIKLALQHHPETLHTTYNITNGDPREFRQLIDRFFAGIDTEPNFRPGKLRPMMTIAKGLEKLYARLPGNPEPPITRYVLATLAFSQTLDISAAQRDLGYKPHVALDDGIDRYAAWCKKRLQHA